LNGNVRCIVCDTDCDYVTPLCSQVTYEGLLDDMFGINSGMCLAPSIFIIMYNKYVSPCNT